MKRIIHFNRLLHAALNEHNFYTKRSKDFLLNFNNYENILFCSTSFYSDSRGHRTYTMGHKQKETFLIVGLGNHDLPGTRHNVGMQLVNKLAEFLRVNLVKKRDCLGFVGEKELRNIHLVVLKPKQAMNISGTSVYKTARKYNIPVANVYVVHDDLDRKVGKVGLKESGSAGGHNGVKSVIQSIKTDVITRIRIGIDRPVSVDMVPDYVLQKFHSHERHDIAQSIDQGILKIAQHIGAKTGLSATQVFSPLEDIDKLEDSDQSSSSEDKPDNSKVT